MYDNSKIKVLYLVKSLARIASTKRPFTFVVLRVDCLTSFSLIQYDIFLFIEGRVIGKFMNSA